MKHKEKTAAETEKKYLRIKFAAGLIVFLMLIAAHVFGVRLGYRACRRVNDMKARRIMMECGIGRTQARVNDKQARCFGGAMLSWDTIVADKRDAEAEVR